MIFKYEGYDRSANFVKGQLEANSENEAKNRLRDLAIAPRSLIQVKVNLGIVQSLTLAGGGGKPNLKDFTVFIRQWSTMQSAGLTLIQCLSVLAEQTPNRKFATVVGQISRNIEEGESLTQALNRHKDVFDKVFINLVSAGETSGTLDRILDRLAVYYEKTAALKRKIVSASLYPAMIFLVVLGVVFGLLVFVVPMFQSMYANSGKELPGPTLVLISVSNFLRHYILFVLLGVAGIIVGIIYAFKTEETRQVLDPFLLKIPIMGMILRKSCIARFSRTLGTLIQAGVPILDAFTLAAKTSGNFEIEEAAMRVQSSVREGSTIAGPLSKEKSIPRMVVSMIAVGEQTGELEKMLVKVAEFYEDEVDATVGALTSILEPIMILTVGAIVVSVLIPLYLPIFKMGDTIGQ